jgi:adrenodoxin-NADP+ reductase
VEAQAVAQKIAKEIGKSNRPGTAGLRELLEKRGARPVDYAGWRRIDAKELSGTSSEKCRTKLCSTNEMLDTAHAGPFQLA